MDDLLAGRALMALSLAFHIIFASIGIAMPLLMVIAEVQWRRTGEEVYAVLAKRWAKGTAILFAVGAVSGTALSFQLGLLWPRFMAFAGAIIGMPFSLEGFAFFTEAIFLGIYLYGWERVSPRAHIFAGAMVALSGVLSGLFVVIANAWMNAPTGFRVEGGRPVDIDPVAALRNPAAFAQMTHMAIAAYAATGFAVAGIHAFFLLRDRGHAFHRRAVAIALAVGGTAALLQGPSGHFLAQNVARLQPLKLAAFEAHFETARGAPLRLGGLPDAAGERVRFSIEVPKLLSVLAFDDPDAEVKGLRDFPRDEWPPVAIVHAAFQVMVAAGAVMMAIALLAAVAGLRARGVPDARWLLRAVVLAAPLGFVAIEAGWVVTEVGRQPWIIYRVMRTSEALTPMPGLVVPLAVFATLYAILAAAITWLLYHQVVLGPHYVASPSTSTSPGGGHA